MQSEERDRETRKAGVKDFHELRVYQMALTAAMEIYEIGSLTDRYDHICAQLVTMIKQQDQWCA